MPLLPAHVVRVDRVTQLAEVMAAGFNNTIQARYPERKNPPPPLAPVFLEQQGGGQWIVREVPALRHKIVDDDFTTASVGAATGALFADSIWSIDPPANWGNAFPGGPIAGIYGSVDIYTQAVANDSTVLRKDDASMTLITEEAIWFSARVAPDSTAGVQDIAGIANAAFTDYAYIQRNAFGVVDLITSGGNTNIPFTTASQVFFTIDIVCIPDVSSSVWINGDGPYTVTSTASPGAGLGLEAYFAVTTTDNVTKLFLIDWCHVEAFTPVIHPDRLYGIGLSPTSAVGHSYLGSRI